MVVRKKSSCKKKCSTSNESTKKSSCNVNVKSKSSSCVGKTPEGNSSNVLKPQSKKNVYRANVYKKSLFNFNEYIVFQDNVFAKNKRANFLNRIQKEFTVKDKKERYARCHSVSYHSMIDAVVKTFNFLYGVRLKKIKDFSYEKAVNVSIEYLAGLALAVKKFPLIISNDYTLLSKNNAYDEIIQAKNVKVAFVEYILSKSLILKLIYRTMYENDIKFFIQDLLCYGNVFLEKLNNTSINLRVGVQKYNASVGSDYDIISYKNAKDGIIIDTEMDCCCLSHIKNIMYAIEDSISYFSPHSIVMPEIFATKEGYEVVTSYQNTKDFAKKNNISDVNIYFNNWYEKEKPLILM